jgi:hypothetical protein
MVNYYDRRYQSRVSTEKYGHLERIAGILAQNGKSCNDGVGTLAKALVFVKVNEFIQIELMQKDIDAREESLKARNVPPQGFGYT